MDQPGEKPAEIAVAAKPPWTRLFDALLNIGCALVAWNALHVAGFLPAPPALLFNNIDWTAVDIGNKYIVYILAISVIPAYYVYYLVLSRIPPPAEGAETPLLDSSAKLKLWLAVYPWFVIAMLYAVTGRY